MVACMRESIFSGMEWTNGLLEWTLDYWIHAKRTYSLSSLKLLPSSVFSHREVKGHMHI